MHAKAPTKVIETENGSVENTKTTLLAEEVEKLGLKDGQHVDEREEDVGDEEDQSEENALQSQEAKKKKKKKNKGKKKKTAGEGDAVESQEPQTTNEWPPQTPLHKSTTTFKQGEFLDYSSGTRVLSKNAEEKHNTLLQLNAERLNNLREAAEIHRRVRKYAQSVIKPGMSMVDICEIIENGTRGYTGTLQTTPNLTRGIAFPTGCSLNHCAAHYTPNSGDKTVLQHGDMLKLDFGVHVNGYIIDAAWTMAFPKEGEETHEYQTLVEAVREATNTGIKAAGVDVVLSDIGAQVEEVMSSYEVHLKNGKVLPVKPIRNLNGHSIAPYVIHGGKTVPIVKNMEYGNVRMEAGEVFAIETFGSTGKGYVVEDGECSHYMRCPDHELAVLERNVRMPKSKSLLNLISNNFGSLAFCRRYLDRITSDRYLLSLKNLVDVGVVNPYPPLCDVKGSMTAQFEHTLFVGETSIEVLSRGDDF